MLRNEVGLVTLVSPNKPLSIKPSIDSSMTQQRDLFAVADLKPSYHERVSTIIDGRIERMELQDLGTYTLSVRRVSGTYFRNSRIYTEVASAQAGLSVRCVND